MLITDSPELLAAADAQGIPLESVFQNVGLNDAGQTVATGPMTCLNADGTVPIDAYGEVVLDPSLMPTDSIEVDDGGVLDFFGW